MLYLCQSPFGFVSKISFCIVLMLHATPHKSAARQHYLHKFEIGGHFSVEGLEGLQKNSNMQRCCSTSKHFWLCFCRVYFDPVYFKKPVFHQPQNGATRCLYLETRALRLYRLMHFNFTGSSPRHTGLSYRLHFMTAKEQDLSCYSKSTTIHPELVFGIQATHPHHNAMK